VSRGLQVALLILGALVFVLALLFSSGTSQVADQALQYELKAIGQSIYEYHETMGQWPHNVGDLARTSLPVRVPYWKPSLESGSIVVVWHDHLNPNPQDNRDVVLAYHSRGTLAMFGRQWVCWGDLRVEYVSSKRLHAALAAAP